MKTVILAGGLGTRLTEETGLRPKPMVEIGDKPILWHIMKSYQAHGVTEFIICLGYRGYMIKEYFANYLLHNSDVTIDLATSSVRIQHQDTEPWIVTLVDTGAATNTGGRLARISHYLSEEEQFFLTYGDGLTDADFTAELQFHRNHDGQATLLAVEPPGRYGAISIGHAGEINKFDEKQERGAGFVNGGFFVVNNKVLERITSDSTSWEKDVLTDLAQDGELHGFVHDGFWHPMDTLREKMDLDAMWRRGDAPWKTW